MKRLRAFVAAMVILIAAHAASAQDAAAEVDPLLSRAGVKGGLCICIGARDGDLLAALAADGKFLVHALSPDSAETEAARENIRTRGLYGRVSVETRSGLGGLPYADDTVNLILVTERADAMRAKGLVGDEIQRVLAPGGVALIGEANGTWTRIDKPLPAEMDEWTHMRHGPDGNMVSRDTAVGIPQRLRWLAEPTWARSHAIIGCSRAMVSASGRFFYVYDAAPRGTWGPMRMTLVARDGFNGCMLWQKPIESTTPLGISKEIREKYWDGGYYWYKRRSLAASGARVYTVIKQGGPLCALDAATGEVVRVYDAAGSPQEVVLSDGRLVLVLESENNRPYGAVCCVDESSGKLLWNLDKEKGKYVLIADGAVFYDAGKDLVRTSLADGSETWRATKPEGAVALAFIMKGRLLLKGRGANVYAVSVADGSPLWTHHYRDFNGYSYSDTDIYGVDGLVWIQVGGEKWSMVGLDEATGEEKKRIDFPEIYPTSRGHHRCHPNRATTRYFILDTHGMDFIEREAGKVFDVRPYRGNCYVGSLPANGLLYIPPNACQCGEYFRGFAAMAPGSKTQPPEEAIDAKARFERGPAFGEVAHVKGVLADWPTYRHDAERSGSTTDIVPRHIDLLWSVDVGRDVTAPTIAEAMVFVARSDSHEVQALDAKRGELRWRYVAGGRVDTPPTVYQGLALFGSRDGWVTCLRAKDGALAWRFRAAPHDRRIVAFGQLESPWPLDGTVLVHDGKAFFSAGRFSELDGGIRMYAAEPASGKLLWQSRVPDCQEFILSGQVLEKGYMAVTINDVLVARGDCASINVTGFNAKTGEVTRPKYVWWPRSGMLDPNSWVGRARWRGPGLTAELLVFDPKTTYGVLTPAGSERALNPGKTEYQLLAKGEKEWTQQVDLRITAMALTSDALFVAGAPDVIDEEDYWAAIEGRRGAEIRRVSLDDGTVQGTLKLEAAPVHDGLAVAGGRLYLSTQDGKLRCFGKK